MSPFGTDYNALWQDPSISDKTLSFEIDSPLFLEVTLPDGTILSEEVDESRFIENDAFYISLGDQEQKALFINSDQEGKYQVKLTPNGDGEYGFTTRVYVEGQEVVEQEVRGKVITTDPVIEYTIQIEKDEDGQINEEVFEIIEIEKDLSVKELLQSLEEDTRYISSKKRLWLQLVELLELPIVQNNDRLYERIETILYRDIRRSLSLDERIERFKDLITEDNEEILRKIIE